MNESLARLITEHRIHEVECVIPDMTGIARGKILPKDLFLGAGEMRLPKSVLLNTVNGQQPDNGPHVGDTDPDMVCRPDAATFRVVPWAAEPVAVVIHDCFEWDGTPVLLSPRAVLRRAGSRTACPVSTSTPTSRSPQRSRAATSAWCRRSPPPMR